MGTPIVRPLTLSRLTARLVAIVSLAAFLYSPSPALAQEVVLGSAEDFAVLGGTAVTCTDSVVIGDVGVAVGGAVTQTNCTISGAVHEGDLVGQQAYEDFLRAYDDLKDEPCEVDLTGQLLDGQMLPPGVYCFDAAVTETGGELTLVGDSDDTWIFKIGTGGTGALTFTNFSVVLTSGEACSNNVFWWTADAATLTDSVFLGSILAGADITVTRGSLDGQALAGGTGTPSGPTGAVTLTNTEVSVCGASTPSQIKVTGGGQIPVPDPDSAGRATFGFNAQPDTSGGGAKGRLNYLNHVTGLHVNGPVDDVVVIATNPDGSPKTIRFSGICGANLPACSFSVTVEDNGEPGSFDEFGIRVTGDLSEVRSQRVLSRGNIQFHK